MARRCQSRSVGEMFQVERRAKFPRREKPWLVKEMKEGQCGWRVIREAGGEETSLDRGRGQVTSGPGGPDKTLMMWSPRGVETCGQMQVFWLSGTGGEASVAFS